MKNILFIIAILIFTLPISAQETANVYTTIYYNHQTYKVNIMPNSTYTFNGKMNLLNNIPFYKPF